MSKMLNIFSNKIDRKLKSITDPDKQEAYEILGPAAKLRLCEMDVRSWGDSPGLVRTNVGPFRALPKLAQYLSLIDIISAVGVLY